jgi:hypothetical protein
MKSIYIAVSLVLIAVMIFAGCSSAAPQTGNGSYDYGKGSGEEAQVPPAAPAEAPAAEPETGLADSDVIGNTGDGSTATSEVSILEPGVNRKVVYNGTIEANTKEFDKDYDMVMSQLRTVGGYVESSNIEGSKPEDREDGGRTAQMVLRVPNDKFDTFITMLKGVGQNLQTNISGQDISLQYYDKETQLTMLQNRKTRLEEMLKNPAYTLDSIVALEKELSDVAYQIQMLETDIRTYDSLVDFSTVNIMLYEVLEITAITPAKEGLGTRISNGFYSVLNVLANIGEALAIFFVSGSPVIVPIVGIIILIIILRKRSNRKRGPNKLPPLPPYMQGGQSNEKQG